MTVYIVRQLHWEYQDFYYGLSNEGPVKAFVDLKDARHYARTREAEERPKWKKHDAKIPDGSQVYDQPFFEIVEVELEP